MKLHPECVSCIMDRAVSQLRIATDDDGLRLKALSLVAEFLSRNISEDAVPAHLGDEQNKIVMRVTSNPDLYRDRKKMNNEAAMELAPYAERLVREAGGLRERLRTALILAVIGNSMEFSVAGHKFDPQNFKGEFDALLSGGLAHDDLDEVISKIMSSKEILYLTDNCGEIIFDRILVKEIAGNGVKVFITGKSIPVQEDVTMDDLRALGIHEFAEIISSGTAVGVRPDLGPGELFEKMEEVDLVLAKGMGNYETISEFEDKLRGRLAYLLRAKCVPVARSLGVRKGALVAKFVK
ncbi:MAG: DUF89 family protein [Hadesarchaea archaeon]|nr:DUF89 family protein [Hadesarchaea archaeon]